VKFRGARGGREKEDKGLLTFISKLGTSSTKKGARTGGEGGEKGNSPLSVEVSVLPHHRKKKKGQKEWESEKSSGNKWT